MNTPPRARFDWGELIIPGLAILYTVANLIDRVIKEVEWKTFMYSVLIGAGVFITAGICVIHAILFSKRRVVTDEERAEGRIKFRKISVFLLLSVGFILSLDYLGYFIAVPLFLIVMFCWLRVRPWWKVILLSAAMLALVHFLFVDWAGMALPVGCLFADLG